MLILLDSLGTSGGGLQTWGDKHPLLTAQAAKAAQRPATRFRDFLLDISSWSRPFQILRAASLHPLRKLSVIIGIFHAFDLFSVVFSIPLIQTFQTTLGACVELAGRISGSADYGKVPFGRDNRSQNRNRPLSQEISFIKGQLKLLIRR
jgi:hypothetical protein